MLVLGSAFLLLLQLAAATGDSVVPQRRHILARSDVSQDNVNKQAKIGSTLGVGTSLEKRQASCDVGLVSVTCSNGRSGCCRPMHTCFIAITGDEGCCPIGENCTTVSGCPSGNFQCSEATGGGCCPIGSTCSASGGGTCSRGGGGGGGGGTTTTATAATPSPDPADTCAAGRFRCAPNLGGGCCPTGMTCTADGRCTSGTGTTPTPTDEKPNACEAGRFRCAPDLGGGCCPNGYTCTADGKCTLGGGGTTGTLTSSIAPFWNTDATGTGTRGTTPTRITTPVTTPTVVDSPSAGGAPRKASWGLGGAIAGFLGLAAVL